MNGSSRGQHLTPEEREWLGERVLLLHSQGLPYHAIAKELGVAKNTAANLIALQLEHRTEARNAKARQLAAYRTLLREAWRRLDAYPLGSSSQNVTGLVNAIRLILERIDKLEGTEAPTRRKYRHEHAPLDLSKMNSEDFDAFTRIMQENFPVTFDEW